MIVEAELRIVLHGFPALSEYRLTRAVVLPLP